MNKKYIQFSLLLVLTLILSYGLGFLYCNFYNLRYNVSSNDIKLVDSKNANYKDKSLIIEPGTESVELLYTVESCKYVDKIKFNYASDESISWNLIYSYKNKFGYDDGTSIIDNTSKSINIFSESVRHRLCSFKITIDSNDSLIKINNIGISNDVSYFNRTILFFVLSGITIFGFVFFRKKIVSREENVFAYIALSIGIIMILTLPFGIAKSWDDEIHFQNVYGIVYDKHTNASLEFINQGNRWERFRSEEENNKYIEFLNKQDKISSSKKTNVKFTYNKFAYIAEIFGLGVGKVLHLSFFWKVNISLLFNLFAYVALIYFAIKNVPIGKKLMLCIGLLPTSLFMATNFNYDTLITAFILLGISLFLKEYFSQDKINYKRIALSVLFLALGSLTKAVYAPLILILLLVDKTKFDSKKSKLIYRICIVVVTLLMLSTFILPSLTSEIGGDPRGGNTDGTAQLHSMLSSPISSAQLFSDNMGVQFAQKLFDKETISCNIWFRQRFVENTYYIVLILIILSTLIANENKKIIILKRDKIATILICLVITALIWEALYLSYTEVGKTAIAGVQGRYFIPLLFPILITLSSDKIQYQIDDSKINKYMSYLLMFALLLAVYSCLF